MRYSILILFTGYISFVSCKKEKPVFSTSKAKTIKARIVEYGTGQPVAGATLSVCTSPLATDQNPCAGSYLSFTSNASGEVFFEADKYGSIGVEKNGYWLLGYEERFITFLGDDPLYRDGIHTAENFLVKIVPQTNITIHIKNNNVSLNHNVSFNREAMFSPEGFSIPSQYEIILRPNIDTTFQYMVFGNTGNLFLVSDYYDPGYSGNIYYQEAKFIPHGNSFILNITY